MTARGRVLVAAVVAFGGAAPGAAVAAGAPPRCAVVDVGGTRAPAAVRSAVEAALAGAKKIQPLPDATVRAALRGEAPASQRLEPAKAALAAAAADYGALKCDEALKHAAKAFDLLEPDVAEPGVRDDLRRALVYLLLCRDMRGDGAGASDAAALLRALAPPAGGTGAPLADAPPGVSRDVWQRYPAPPARATHSIEVRTEAPGAQVLIDLFPVGVTPLTVAVAPGRHRLVVARPAHVPWRRQIEVEKSGVVYEVSLAKRPLDRHESLREAALAITRRPKGERTAAAVRVGRETGAERVLAFEVHKGRLRAELLDAAGQPKGGLFEADAQKVVARPADLTVYLDGADAAVAAKAPASRPAEKRVKIGSRWWHYVIGAAVVAALGVAIWQSEKSSSNVTIQVTKP
jgi:hypothetical protein